MDMFLLGGRAIGQALALNTTLTSLDLRDNSLGEGAGQAIGQSLTVNTTLTQLNLRLNQLREGGGRAIRQALADYWPSTRC
jgi:Ran GTPase-activating protein (RanGAP) involved in mRNA processing and transport